MHPQMLSTAAATRNECTHGGPGRAGEVPLTRAFLQPAHPTMMIDRQPHRFADAEPMSPDVILPSQWLPEFPQRLMPEKRLLIAIVDDSVNCFLKYRFATDARGQRRFDEVMRWLLAEETDWPYSFESICEVLDLDANAVRHRLRLARRKVMNWNQIKERCAAHRQQPTVR